MTEFNGKIFERWEDYITDKFPNSHFDVSGERIAQSGKVITIQPTDLDSKTRIVFNFPVEDYCICTFYHPDSPQHNASNDRETSRSFMFSDYAFNGENLAAMDSYLKIPLYFGWTEEVTYFNGKLVKSQLLFHDGIAWHTWVIERNISWFDQSGCLVTLLFWPVLYIQHLFAKRMLSWSSKDVKIERVQILPILRQ